MPEAFTTELNRLGNLVFGSVGDGEILTNAMYFVKYAESFKETRDYLEDHVNQSWLYSHKYLYKKISNQSPREIISDWEAINDIFKPRSASDGVQDFVRWTLEQFENIETKGIFQKPVYLVYSNGVVCPGSNSTISHYTPKSPRALAIMQIMISSRHTGSMTSKEIYKRICELKGSIVGNEVKVPRYVSATISEINKAFKGVARQDLFSNFRNGSGYHFNTQIDFRFVDK